MNGYQSDPTRSSSISPTRFDPLINLQTRSPSRAPKTPTVVPIKGVCLRQDATGFVYEHSNGERNKRPWIANGKTLKNRRKRCKELGSVGACKFLIPALCVDKKFCINFLSVEKNRGKDCAKDNENVAGVKSKKLENYVERFAKIVYVRVRMKQNCSRSVARNIIANH